MNTKGLVPIFVSKDMILLPSKNIRAQDGMYVNFNRIIQYVKHSSISVKVIFEDLSNVNINTSYEKFHKQYQYAKELLKKFSDS